MSSTSIEQYRTDPDFQTPGVSRGILDVVRHRYLLGLLMRKGAQTRYYGSVLGWIWSYIRPATQFLMYYLVIGVILGVNRGIEFFPIYLFAGISAVNLFSEILRNTTSSITDNKALIGKIFLPRELFPVAACFNAVVHFLPQAFILLVAALLFGWKFSFMAIIYFVGAVLMIMAFALGVGMFFGAFNALYRDAINIVNLILMFAIWASPVMYSFQMVKDRAPEWIYHIFMSNPVTVAVELFHNAFWFPLADSAQRPGEWSIHLGIATVATIIALIIGQISFKKLEASFAQRL